MTIGKEALNGTWILVASELRREDGVVEYPYGKSPTGILVYTPNGRYAVQVTGTDRKPFATDDIWEGTREELREAFGSYNAHFGRIDVHWNEGFVVHHIEGSLLPNWVGGEQLRNFILDGDRLELRTPRLHAGKQAGYGVLTWKRDTVA